jgi:uncharacterized protein DUF6632
MRRRPDSECGASQSFDRAVIDTGHRWLSIVLLVTGIAFILAPALIIAFPDSWSWEPRQHEYEQMIQGIYFVLGTFAVAVARAPMPHMSLIWFIAVSNIVHGGIMLVQAMVDPAEHANFHGDIPALIVSGMLIGWLAASVSRTAPSRAARPM